MRRTRVLHLDRDAFGILLVAILTTLVLLALGRAAGPAVIVVQGGTLIFGLWIAGSGPRIRTAAVSVVAASTVVAIVNAGTPGRAVAVTTTACGVLLAIGTMVAIMKHTRTHRTITIATVYAVLSVYLLIGLAYAYLYDLIGAAFGGSFFHDATAGKPLDYMYFSFVTLTTVGYGDLTPAGGGGRMLAVSEAILGQLYLVSVVALVVGNFGRQRDRRPDADPD